MFSIITPTHNPQFLAETHASLQAQGGVPFEWVIVPSPDVFDLLPDCVRADSRVRVVPYRGEPLIGAIKNFAFNLGRGDVLVELDHDDLLVPGALAAIRKQIDKGADFVYSDTASFNSDTLQPAVYAPDFGWTSYPMTVYGRTFYAAESFEVNARSLCEIAFAPDHVRCWTKKAYQALGGHDVLMCVGDDHDLLCRTYLAGHKFASTGACHYLYRIHDGNTVKHRHTMIQDQSRFNRDKYLRPLIYQWSTRHGHPGCMIHGQSRLNAWCPTSDSFTLVSSAGSLQTLTLDECIQFFNKAHNALVPGGWLIIDVPSSDDEHIWDDPHCKSYHSPSSFDWFTDHEYASLDPSITCRFQAVSVKNVFDQQTKRLHVQAELMALKGSQRVPGQCKI